MATVSVICSLVAVGFAVVSIVFAKKAIKMARRAEELEDFRFRLTEKICCEETGK